MNKASFTSSCPRVGAALLTLVIAFVLTGCCDIKLPSISVGQLVDPERAKHEVTADVCYKFPKCTFDSPDQQQQFKDTMDAINQAGASLRPMLAKGDLTADQFVFDELILEFYASQLLSFCEQSNMVLTEPTKSLVLTAAERSGSKAEVEQVVAAPPQGRLQKLASATKSFRSRLESLAK